MQKMNRDGAPGVEIARKNFKLSSFIAPNDGVCGFLGVFKGKKSESDQWIIWECQLPKIKGIGREEDSYERVMAIRSTLWLFSTALWLFGGNTGWHLPQLMVIEGICLPDENRMSSGSLSVTLMPPVMPWLAKQGYETHIEPLIKAMKSASNHMWPESSCRGRFGALVRKQKWLHLDVPGDACGLDPGSGSYNNQSLDDGYTLQPHNVDSSLQQLTFLAGLAKLHDLVRG